MVRNTPRWLPSAMAGFLVLVSLSVGFYRVNRMVTNPEKARSLETNDSKHYLEIARALSEGDFSMAYVTRRAHRQPLYPLVLSSVIAVAGENKLLLASVNVVLGALAVGAAYLMVSTMFGSRAAGVLVALLLVVNPFWIAVTTKQLLTEPLHILLMLGVIYCFLQYLRERRTRWLLLTVGCAGLDYLTRPNGLFVSASALAVLALADLLQLRRTESAARLKALKPLAARYALAVALLVVVTLPSWLPRLRYNGNPLDHGYVANFLWVDTYEAGHVREEVAQYTWRDYAATHTLGDIAARWVSGIKRVGFQVPARQEGIPVLYLLAVAGGLVALRSGPSYLRYLLLFFILQILPLIWTSLSNPTPRVPYGAMLAFELVLAGFFLAWLAERWKRDGAGARARGREGEDVKAGKAFELG